MVQHSAVHYRAVKCSAQPYTSVQYRECCLLSQMVERRKCPVQYKRPAVPDLPLCAIPLQFFSFHCFVGDIRICEHEQKQKSKSSTKGFHAQTYHTVLNTTRSTCDSQQCKSHCWMIQTVLECFAVACCNVQRRSHLQNCTVPYGSTVWSVSKEPPPVLRLAVD